MPMYNLLEYSKNYRKTIGSLYNYYRDELANDNNDNFANRNVVNSSPFKYKYKIIGNTYNVNAGADGYDVNKNGTQKIELAIPLKYLGDFWRALNIPLISCEVFLELKWNKNYVITSLEQRQVDAGPPVVRDNAPTGATLSITDCRLYVPIVTLSKDDEIKLLTNYGVYKNTDANNPDTIKYDTRILNPNLCDYAEAYILVDGTIRGTGGNNNNTRLALKNCAPFTKCNLKINDEHVDTAENLDIVMPMYNLIEYSDNYQDSSVTTRG